MVKNVEQLQRNAQALALRSGSRSEHATEGEVERRVRGERSAQTNVGVLELYRKAATVVGLKRPEP